MSQFKQNSGLDNVTALMENLTVKLDATGFCDLEPLRFTYVEREALQAFKLSGLCEINPQRTVFSHRRRP